ncbi:MAG TPA: biotin-dependent carboxyltransferase family protein, partial [Candidatus Acidoferrum sp.]|nr:biotin-dependent carboxyltransferase family protein [Candidatus Acidoferrum sp.]
MLRVEKPGLFTTIQDLGRPNAIASGVPAGGAMDRFAHRAANLLAGNDEGAATLECTLNGPELVAMGPCVVAIAGADFDPHVNGRPAPMWTSVFLSDGDVLSFAGRRWGARAYIALTGGMSGDRWLGSMSTNLLLAQGGM